MKTRPQKSNVDTHGLIWFQIWEFVQCSKGRHIPLGYLGMKENGYLFPSTYVYFFQMVSKSLDIAINKLLEFP